jgi:hypothetical protein
MWFLPLVAQLVKAEAVASLGELVDFCNARGGSWWRAVPRIGAGRARHVVSWLRRHADTIGTPTSHWTIPSRRGPTSWC